MLTLSATVQLYPAVPTLGIGRQRQRLVSDNRIAVPTLPKITHYLYWFYCYGLARRQLARQITGLPNLAFRFCQNPSWMTRTWQQVEEYNSYDPFE